MKVYVDTSALLPLIHRDDQDHAKVVAAAKRLAEEKAALVTTSYVLVETGALVKRRLGVAAFRSLGQAVEQAMDVLWVDEELHNRAWEEASRGGKQGPSLVDCVGFLAMRARAIDTALSLDDHFRKAGFELVP